MPKSILTLLFSLIALAWFPSPLGANGLLNLVSNPSFEKADVAHPDRPAGFACKNAGRAGPKDIIFSWEESGYRGKKAIAIETLEPYLGYWETVVPVKPETEYIVSYYYKCRSSSSTTYKGAKDREYREGRPGGPNLELGVVPDDPSKLSTQTDWSDIGIALGPVGGTYAPVATEWSLWRQKVRTLPGQSRMRLKLRLYCYIQKVWFDDLSVVESSSLPEIAITTPAPKAVIEQGKHEFRWDGPKDIESYLVEYSSSPTFSRPATTRSAVKGERLVVARRLAQGLWFWHVGIADQEGIPQWIAESSFEVATRQWIRKDTTPPTVCQPNPVPNANTSPDVLISASYNDVGSGIDVSSVVALVDGKLATTHSNASHTGISLKPVQPLTDGRHYVEISVADKAGNRSNRLVWQFGVGKMLGDKIEFPNGLMTFNSEPYFPIGIWNYQCHPDDGRFNENSLAQAVASGYNFVLDTIDTKQGLDKLFKHGMKSLLYISDDMKACLISDSMRATLIDKGQAQFAKHPSVIGYWADDVANLENTDGTPTPPRTREILVRARAIYKEHTPNLPLVWCFSNLARLEDSVSTADVLLPYRYPIPHFHPKTILDWTMNVVYPRAGDRPIWINTQADDVGLGYCDHFQSKEGTRPTPDEMRVMAYYSLVLGARGWTLYCAGPKFITPHTHPEHWREALKLASEMRYLSPVLAAGKKANTVSLEPDSSSGAIEYLELEHNEIHTLIAANLTAGRVTAKWRFHMPSRAVVLFEDRVMSKGSTSMGDWFKPFEVHVYQWQL